MEACEDASEYKPGGYHPVKIGDIYYERYKVLQKIGFGHFSTVWLCEDLKSDSKVALKIQKSASHYTDAAMDEIDIVSKLHRNYSNPKWSRGENANIVKLSNHFMHKGPNGNHVCIAFELLGGDLLQLMKHFEFKGVPIRLCKLIAKQTLIALDFLHRICGVIHTDIKPENILMKLNDDQVKEIEKNKGLVNVVPYIQEVTFVYPEAKPEISEKPEMTKREMKNYKKIRMKKARKERRGIIDVIQPIEIVSKRLDSDIETKIVDFGNACWVHRHFSDEIQTLHYRSPEAILGVAYNQFADIWSFGCVLYELLVGNYLFNVAKTEGREAEIEMLTQIFEINGKGCFDWAMRGKNAKKFVGRNGKIEYLCNTRSIKVEIMSRGINENEAEVIEDLILMMIKPNPQLRASANDCLNHRWLADI